MRNHCKSQHNGENIALGISDDNDDLSSTKATLILEQGDKDWLIISLPVNPRLIRFSTIYVEIRRTIYIVQFMSREK